MGEIFSSRQLQDRGLSRHEIAASCRHGELVRIRRNGYGLPATGDDEVDALQDHRRLTAATWGQLGPGAVISHQTAAMFHELPLCPTALPQVHVTRDRSYGGKVRSLVHVHVAPLGPSDIVVVDGLPVTSPARTVADLARALPYEQAVAAGDAALRRGLARTDLDQVLAGMGRWPRIRRARRAAAFLDHRSESVGESVSRVRIRDDGLPAPDLQRDVVDGRGRLVARVDFCWPEQRTVGEFDGKVKYGRLLRPGQSGGDAVFDEKIRKDILRDLGWQVVRWMWSDLYRPGVIRDRLLRAFNRAG